MNTTYPSDKEKDLDHIPESIDGIEQDSLETTGDGMNQDRTDV